MSPSPLKILTFVIAVEVAFISGFPLGIQPGLTIRLDLFFKIAAFSWINILYGEAALFEEVSEGRVLSRVRLNAGFVDLNEAGRKRERTHIVHRQRRAQP